MKATEFAGHSSEMREDTPWLSSEDLLDRGDVPAVIEKCHHVLGAEFDGGRKEDVYTLSFVGKKKQLVLNATNRKTLVAMFGANVSKWPGKSIKLQVVRGKWFGKVQNGIRIKNEASMD